MAARFPQSGSAVTWQIKAAWASKIHAIYWAAGADSVHRLYPGDTVTTIITRSASGAGFNSADGRITGNNNTTFFTDSKAGGIGGLNEASNFGFFGAFYGDNWNGANALIIGSMNNPDTFNAGFRIRVDGFGCEAQPANDSTTANWAWINDVDSLVTIACRHDQADGTNDVRSWYGENGSTAAESVAQRRNITVHGTPGTIGTTTGPRPIYLGGSDASDLIEWECCGITAVLSDADMVTLATNPADVIELVSASGPTIDTHPSDDTVTEPDTGNFTVAATTSGGTLTYQWQVDNGGGFANVSTGSGGTTNSYTTGATDGTMNGYDYRCQVTDDNGTTASNSANLTVNSTPQATGAGMLLGVG